MVEEESKLIGLEVLHVMLQGPINDMCSKFFMEDWAQEFPLAQYFEKVVWKADMFVCG